MPSLLHNRLDPIKYRFESDVGLCWQDSNLFCALAEVVTGNVAVLKRSRMLCKRPSSLSHRAELETLLEDAKREDVALTSWTFALPNESCKTCAVTIPSSNSSQRFHPQRILRYDDAPQAGIYISWRICRIRMLDIVSQAYDLLACFYSEDNREEKEKVDKTIACLADDICSSIPFYLGWSDHVGEIYGQPGKIREVADSLTVTGIEMIANWSQLMPVIWATTSLTCVPAAQREWLGEYLTLLSNDPRKTYSISYFDAAQRFTWLEATSYYDHMTERTSPS